MSNAIAIATAGQDAERQQRYHRERVAELFGLGQPAYVVSPLNGAVLFAILWGTIASEVLAGWMTGMLAIAVGRMLLHAAYLRAPSAASDPLLWEKRFVVGAVAAGALWGMAPVLFFGPAGGLERIAVMFVNGGLIIGAAGVYAASSRAYFGFILLPALASAGVLLVQDAETYRWMAAMVVLFALAMAAVYRQIHRSVCRTLLTRLENEALVAQLGENEARLRDAIGSSPDGIAIYDKDDRLVVCNAAYASVYAPGSDSASMAGKSFSAIAEAAYDVSEQIAPSAPQDRAAWIEWRMGRHERASGELHQYRTRDGRWMQGKTVSTPMGGRVGVFTDISETKRAEEAYQAVLAEENLVLEILPVGVAFVEKRTIVRCNHRLESMLGYSPGALDGKPTRVLYSSDSSWKTVGGDTYTRLARGGVIESDTRMVRADGTPVWCHSLGRSLDPADPEAAAIFAFSDAEDRHKAEQALRESEALYRNLVETSNDLIWSTDREARWTYLNGDAVRRIWGAEAADMLGRPVTDTLVPEVRDRDLALFRQVLQGEDTYNYETRHLRRDGVPVDLSLNAIALRDAAGKVIGATGTARDITESKKAAAALYESVARLRLAVDAADLYYWEWDLQDDSFTWGRDPGSLLGLAAASEPNPDFRTMIHPDDRERYEQACARTLETGESHSCEFRIVGRGSPVRWLSARGRVVYGENGAANRVIGVSQDVSERKRQEEEVRYLAYHDTLTGLPNRRLLDDRLQQAVFAAQRREARVAVMIIDLDHFKDVNDTLGHKAGDAVLREVANRLTGCVRKADTLARQGGDEFVIVIPELPLESDCSIVAEKILRTLVPEIRVDGRSFTIGASIGISLFPNDAGDGETLLRNADVAMYRAKELGRNNYRFYGR